MSVVSATTERTPVGYEGSTVMLVDFDNFFPHARDGNVASWAPHTLNRLITQVLAISPSVSQLDLRLYGGWLQDGVLTNFASGLQSIVAAAPFFPVRHPNGYGILRGAVTLVTRVISLPAVEWGDTLHARGGLPRLRLSETPLPNACAGDLTSCPLRVVYKFAKGRSRTCLVAGCAVTSDAAFSTVEQKMVDTLITCDLMTLALRGPGQEVILCSDDIDFVPALGVATTLGEAQITRLVTNTATNPFYASVLDSVGVNTLCWSS